MTSERESTIELKPVHSLHDALLVKLSSAAAIEGGDSAQSIHGARKEMKKIRAGLRLLRPALGQRNYQWANREVRDAGKSLTSVRDAAVLLHILDAIAPRKSRKDRALAAALRLDLAKNCESQRGALTQKRLEGITVRLDRATEFLRAAIPVMPDSAAAKRGVKKVYAAGRNAYMAARKQPSVMALHEWRKQVKYLYNGAQLLCVYQVGLKKLRRRLKRLAELLGDDHDLAALRERLRKCNSKQSKRLLAHIRRKRRKLQGKALDLGGRFYEQSAQEFAVKVRKALRHSLT